MQTFNKFILYYSLLIAKTKMEMVKISWYTFITHLALSKSSSFLYSPVNEGGKNPETLKTQLQK